MVQKETEAQPGAEQTAADEPAPESPQKLIQWWCNRCAGYTLRTDGYPYRCAKCGGLASNPDVLYEPPGKPPTCPCGGTCMTQHPTKPVPVCLDCGEVWPGWIEPPAETITEAFDELAAAWKPFKAELQAVVEPPVVWLLNLLTRWLK